MKRENVFCLTDAIRLAINNDTFNRDKFAIFQK